MRALVLLLEDLIFPLAALAFVLKFALSRRRGLLLSLGEELGERLGRAPDAPRDAIWVHAASAGEVNAARPLIERLKSNIIVSCTTAAGRQRACELPGVSARLAPLDCGPAVRRFVREARPKALILVETELWPRLIAEAPRVALVNGRLSSRSFARYRLIAPLLRPFLSKIERLAVQTELDAERFIALGARREAVAVCGNMKYDLPPPPPPEPKILETLGWPGPVLVAGSTHPVEEDHILEAVAKNKGLRLIIAPRHIERAEELARALERAGLSFCRWNALRPGCDALLVDARGPLWGLYGLGTAAFVGGTLVTVGGHNLLEPALHGVPVLFGPHTDHTPEPARLLESAGGGFCVSDAAGLSAVLAELLADPARAKEQGRLAKKTAQSFSGATDRTLAHIAPLL